MQPIIDGVAKFLIENLSTILLTVLLALTAKGIVLLRRVPAILHDLAAELAKAAAKTPGPADDVAAKALSALADVLAVVIAKHFPKG